MTPWRLVTSGSIGAMLAAIVIVLPHLAEGQMSQYPADVSADSGFRLPLPQREALDDEGKKAYDRAIDPARGSLVGLRGPGGIQIYSPKVAEYGSALNRYLRQEAGLGGRIRELAILTTAREFDSQFEWFAHEAVGLKEGLPQSVIDVVKFRQATDGMAEADAVVIDLGREVFRTHKVTAPTYARALKQFGPKGLVNLVALMGNYAGTATLLAVFDMQLPPGQTPLLPVP